jgi:hypothetical protein
MMPIAFVNQTHNQLNVGDIVDFDGFWWILAKKGKTWVHSHRYVDIERHNIFALERITERVCEHDHPQIKALRWLKK